VPGEGIPRPVGAGVSGPPPGDPGAGECLAALGRAFAVLGKRWTGLVLGVLLTGPASFSALRGAVPAVSDSVLSARLRELGHAGLVQRSVDAGPPLVVGYRLTAAGAALAPAFDELRRWAAAFPRPACSHPEEPGAR
jgi:DNA-binding HxlR family transcriptional regulator